MRLVLAQLAGSLRGLCIINNGSIARCLLESMECNIGRVEAVCGATPARGSVTGWSSWSLPSMSALHRKFSAITGPEDHAESTAHVESIEEIRSRIFGTHIGNGLRSGRKILRRKLVGEKIASYYPKDILKVDPFMPDLNAERAKLKLDRLKRRGKAPPKKGAGKRASKKR